MICRNTTKHRPNTVFLDADPQNFQELDTFAIWFYVGGLQKSFFFLLYIIEGSLNRNFRQYGQLKSRVE